MTQTSISAADMAAVVGVIDPDVYVAGTVTTGAKDVTGAAITQLTQAGTDSDKQAVIAMASEDLDVTNNFTHVRLSMTVAVATSDAGAIVLGMSERYGPASGIDQASVDEIVRV